MTPRQVKEVEAQEELGIVPESSQVFGPRSKAFDRLIEERISLKEMQKQVETDIKEIDEKLQNYFADSSSKKVQTGNVVAQLCHNPGQSKLSRELLLEKGVAASVIAACTVQGKSYDYILVTAPKSSNSGR